ncbi:MAG: hypothetical protein VB078_00325 [Clostridiaceae bacterium]|nr:hypothetical protein [Clostridiaceae bacterium]
MKIAITFLIDATCLVLMGYGACVNSTPAVLFGGAVLIANAVREGKQS